MHDSFRRARIFLVFLSCVIAFVSADKIESHGQDEIDFNRDIRPLLSDRCFKCHGPDEASRESDWSLDQKKLAEPVLSGEKLEEIEFWNRINSDDPDEMMPPPDSKLKLSDQEKQLLKKWLQSGSPYETHWAFSTPKKSGLPKVTNGFWVKNEIDHFVLDRLRREKLTPNKEASRERLIRRVTFDLTGLPPSPAEVEAFVNDTAPNAYEKVVDRLLKSDAYGERMTAEWLDVARYSDSFGYQVDRPRHVWPWRDWVIRAFNSNLSYDQFIIQQLAGDLIPNASDDQILATAFNRLHPQKVEGGSVPEEFRVEYVADRNHTFATAFLGLTMECARCHDHKYDPVTQKEYYQLFAYFNNIDEAGLYSYFTSSTPTPTLLLTNQQQKEKQLEIEKSIRELEQQLAQHKPTWEEFKKWISENSEIAPVAPIEHLSFEDFKSGRNKSVDGKVGKAVKLTGDDAVGLKTGNFNRNQSFSIGLWLQTPDLKERAVVFHRSRAWTDAASRGYQLLLEDGRASFSLIHFWPGNAFRVITKNPLPVNEWVHLLVTYDGSSKAGGTKLFINGKRVATEIVRDNLYKNITGGGGDKIAIGERFRDRGFTNGLVDEFKVFDRELSELEVADVAGIKKLVALKADDKTEEKVKQLWLEFFKLRGDAKSIELRKQLLEKRSARSKNVDGVVEIMVMNDLKKRRKTFVLNRGAYDQPRDEVAQGIPAVFGSNSNPQNRLELAKWIVSKENPLTARVTVNRYWQLIFGNGLVRTPEDFGSQGAPPTHPKLLDWLAVDFMEHDWDLKRLVKKMVMSGTYRQDSLLTKSLYLKDPENLLLARSSSFRMSAEMLRDNALACSDLLVNKIGGGGAKPYDLPLSFKPIGADGGEGLYRRSVYTYWKRTGPSPMMMTLDAAKRDVCTVKRERTATPLQSFVLLNSPQFVESARMLAGKLLSEAKVADGKPVSDKEVQNAIQSGFRVFTSRLPSATESKILMQDYRAQLEYFSKNKDATTKYLAVGKKKADAKFDSAQLAALTATMQTIMNYDEAVMRR